MAWWMWVVFGLGLLVAEIVTPGGLVALFFGASALVVSILAAVGAGPEVQWVVFTVVSVVLLVTLRNKIQQRLRSSARVTIDSLVGQEVILLTDLPAGGEAKAELRGVPWSARAEPGVALAKGQRCKVERVDGVLLYVTAVQQ